MKISAFNAQAQKNEANEKISFSGVKRTYSDNLEDVYSFYAPPYDKTKHALVLEMCEVATGDDGNFYVVGEPFVYNQSVKDFDEKGETILPRDYEICEPEETYLDDKTGEYKTRAKFIGYRFKVIDRNALKNIDLNALPPADYDSPLNQAGAQYYIHDPGVPVSKDGADFTVLANQMGMNPKGGTGLHTFWGSKLKPEDLAKAVKNNFVSTHFNRAGGTIGSITAYQDEIKPFGYVMSNPTIGADSKSPHMYWGENFFRVHNVEEFKEVLTGLYENGTGYVADGAFTSQSIQSPLFQDVLKHGKDSPYYNWFKINGRIRLGVLPDNLESGNPNREKAMDHIGYKIINPKGVAGYDPKKPSYIQFFDDRLASEEQQNDTKNLIGTYDIKNPKDHLDITTHEDSIIPFYFELDYTDKSVAERFSGYGKRMLNDPKIKDQLEAFFSFKNYDITRKQNASGVNFWGGQTDLVKMNLAGADNRDGNYQGMNQVRHYLWDVASHWTKFAHDSLFEDLATLFSEGEYEKLAEIADKSNVSAKEFEATIKNVKNSNDDERVDAKELVSKSLDEFHFESLETSPQLTPILASPVFNKIMKGDKAKEIINNQVIGTLKEIEKSATEDIFEEDGKTFTTYGRYIADLIVPKIITYNAINAIFPKSPTEMNEKGMIITSKEVREKSLYDTGITISNRPADEAEQLAKLVLKRMSNAGGAMQGAFSEQFAKTHYANYRTDDLKFADAMLKKTGGGLNWRFDAAKDVADLNSLANGMTSAEQFVDDIIDVWKPFVSNIRKYNPKSFIVLEVTDFGSYHGDGHSGYFVEAREQVANKIHRMELEGDDVLENYARNVFANKNNGRQPSDEELKNVKDSFKEFSKRVLHGHNVDDEQIPDYLKNEVYNRIGSISAKDWGKYQDPNTAERKIMEQTGATAPSNYSQFFNMPDVFGQNFEYGNVDGGAYRKMDTIKKKLEEHLHAGPILQVMNSHLFYGNHDKPRALHCLALDMGAYLSDFGKGGQGISRRDGGDIWRAKEAAIRVLGDEPKNYDILSSKGIVAGDAIKTAFARANEDGKFNSVEGYINEAIKQLSLGVIPGKADDRPDYLRAEAFGQDDLDISINDIINRAKLIAGDNWPADVDEKLIEKETYKVLMGPALKMLPRLTDTMLSLTGIPFIYDGDNMGMTGYEYATKNIAVQNRNALRHDWVDPNSENFKPEVYECHKRMQARAGLSRQYGLSAIADGVPISLDQQRDDLYAVLKYDSRGSVVVQAFSNVGIPKDSINGEFNENAEPMKVKSIKVFGEGNQPIEIGDGETETTIENKGTEDEKEIVEKIKNETNLMYRKVYDKASGQYVDETENGQKVKYCIVNGELRRWDNKDIEFSDTVSTFYKAKGVKIARPDENIKQMKDFMENNLN